LPMLPRFCQNKVQIQARMSTLTLSSPSGQLPTIDSFAATIRSSQRCICAQSFLSFCPRVPVRTRNIAPSRISNKSQRYSNQNGHTWHTSIKIPEFVGVRAGDMQTMATGALKRLLISQIDVHQACKADHQALIATRRLKSISLASGSFRRLCF
jgi:hypothetical protein